MVNACLREGLGGSPTAVLDETPLSDDERRDVPVLAGTSHAVFISASGGERNGADVSLRFFTAEGELPACGHGTVAALAVLAERAGQSECQVTLSASGRIFTGRVVRENSHFDAVFDPGSVGLREPAASEHGAVLRALGVTSDTLAPGMCVASLGRPRLLVPVTTRAALTGLVPDFGELREACDRLGLLGCYVHSVPTADGRVAARMFAPSIGVPEDIANANSTACLAAHLARQGMTGITVDMGDSLGNPSAITAVARCSGAGPLVHVGGTARVVRVLRLQHADMSATADRKRPNR
ncbi:PhzF family phenazine biosynthesis isomerase [Streptomyces sp. NPDC002928]|uniref:PhzF family phenazine biosynthesis protein n=1 Tax=Streptomyces sp. NPDC002928 TaxID=3154440 RepID=UPI0033B18A60